MLFKIIIALLLFLEMSFADVAQSFNQGISEDSLRTFTVDSLEISVGDAFDDSKAHTFLDSAIYRILNVVHIETQKAVIKKLLLFDVGDTVSLYELIESERYLRDQRYISDAKIVKETVNGKNVMKVNTSDNWTLSVPVMLEHPGDEWYYGIGLQEINFLGFGQTVGVYYSHDEFRDKFQGLYENSNFLFRHNHLRALYSYNTDGYTAFAQMNLPYLSRSKNTFAYTIEGFSSESDVNFYASGKRPKGSVLLNSVANDTVFKNVNKLNDGNNALKIMTLKNFKEDSLSIRLGHSFGTPVYKLYATLSYDYHDYGNDYASVKRYVYADGDYLYAIGENALNDWISSYTDSRPGIALEFSRIRYDRLINYKNVKWIEDVDRGYSLKAKLSKNWKTIGASDNDFRLDYKIALAFGNAKNSVSLNTNSFFYFDESARRDIYEQVSFEYVFKPLYNLATALDCQMDTYKRASYGRELTLGGAEGMNGLPTAIFAGQARFYANLEQRFFPNFEIGTVMPVFTVFLSAGETTNALHEFEPRDLQYLAGFGIRLGMTKSITHMVNHINLSFPVHGPLEKSIVPRISVIAKYNL